MATSSGKGRPGNTSRSQAWASATFFAAFGVSAALYIGEGATSFSTRFECLSEAVLMDEWKVRKELGKAAREVEAFDDEEEGQVEEQDADDDDRGDAWLDLAWTIDTCWPLAALTSDLTDVAVVLQGDSMARWNPSQSWNLKLKKESLLTLETDLRFFFAKKNDTKPRDVFLNGCAGVDRVFSPFFLLLKIR